MGNINSTWKALDAKLSFLNYNKKIFGLNGIKWWEWLVLFSYLFIILSVTFITMEYSLPIWLNALNVLAGVTAVLSMLSITRPTKWQGVFGGLNVIFYGVLAIYSSLWGEVFVNLVFFLPTTVIIFVTWKADSNDGEVKLRKMTLRNALLTGAGVVGIVILGGSLMSTTTNPSPYLDTLSSTISVVAMFLLIFKYRENFIGWFAVNVVSVAMWVVAGLNGDPIAPAMITMWSLYTFNAALGYIVWAMKMKNQNTSTLKQEYIDDGKDPKGALWQEIKFWLNEIFKKENWKRNA